MKTDNLFEQYIDYHSQNAWINKRSESNYFYYKSKDLNITGDITLLSQGIIVGRGYINLDKSQNYTHMYENFSPYLRMHFFSNGGFQYCSSHLNKVFTTSKHTFFVYGGNLGLYSASVVADGQTHCRLSIDIPFSLFEKWKEQNLLSGTNIIPLNQENYWNVYDIKENIVLRMINSILETKNFHMNLDFIGYESLVLSLVGKAFKLISYEQENDIDNKSSEIDFKINRAIHIINNEFGQKITIESLSERVSLNESYLKNRFKLVTGKTISEYITDIRMQNAMNLLLINKINFQQIAYITGYKDYSHFLKVFKKKFGCVPKDITN